MRGLTVIGIAFIAAVVVDVGLSLLNPGHWLPVAVCGAIGEVGMLASLFVVPGWFIFTSIKTRALNSLALRAFLAVMVTWFLAITFRGHFSLPALRATARLRNDPDYDGIGGNAAVLLGGWIFPLFVTVIMAVVQQRRLVAQRSQNASSSRVLPDSVAAPEELVGK
jgi:hypothetical protein